jgi:glycosyltransferase involved in cell wall biosynthesis
MALDVLRRGDARVHGLVVGDGPLRAAMEEHVRTHGTPCTMTGFFNQGRMAAAYAASDALVLPSTGGETWGLVVNEAMAAGVPGIVSDQAGCAPDLIVEGRTGFSFPCGDIAALAERMRAMATEQATGAMRGAVLRHVDRFTPEAAAAGVVTAMERTLREYRPCRC